MNNKIFTIALIFALVGILFAENRPNFLFIVADDLGYADVGFHGSTVVDTPYLDRLAQNGVIFKKRRRM